LLSGPTVDRYSKRWIVIQALILSVGLIAVGCGGGGSGGGDDQGALRSKLSGPPVILAFGDSITWGWGDTPDPSLLTEEGGYPHRLENLLQLPVINSGLGGEKTAAGLARLPRELAKHHPDYVILLEGTNDMYFSGDTTGSTANMEAMIREVIAAHAVPVLGTIPPFCYHAARSKNAPSVNIYNHELRALSVIDGVKLIDFYRAFTGSLDGPCDEAAGLMSPDGIHPTPAGYDVMAAAAADVLDLQ
jgi:acyl-CoA thioesterase I